VTPRPPPRGGVRWGVFLERFEREAKLEGSLNHPNVVALYDVGFQDGKPYFVTELLEGDSMRKRRDRPHSARQGP
jgi:eukaryotic-like serine/threonine-protein kinase